MTAKSFISICLLTAAGIQNASAASSGLYAFLDVGNSDVDRFVSSVDRIDGDETSLGVGIGYQFVPNWSVQISYVDLGEVSATVGCPPDFFCIAAPGTTLLPFSPDTADINGFAVELLGSYPISGYPLAVFGKVGVMDWNSDWRFNSAFDESKTDLVYGLGLKWTPDGSRWGLAISYDEVDMDIKSVKIGTTFQF